MTSTTGEIAGFKITRNVGFVDAFILRGIGAAGNILGGLQSLAGGKLSAFTDTIETTRKDAYSKMEERAGQMGANAIIGIRCTTQGYATEGAREFYFYGTAVLVEPQ